MEIPNVGGTNSIKPADEFIQGLVDQVAPQIKNKTGKDYPHLKAISYKIQVLTGTNYFVKIDAGKEYIHARISKALSCYGGQIELNSLEQSKSRSDPIEYF